MGGGPITTGRPDEDEKARVDRELMELLNELRVALPGVQVLLAFLLILPFSPGFKEIRTLHRGAFLVALTLAAAATALLMAPAAHHRVRFRSGVKEQMLLTGNRLTVLGLALLAASISVALFLAVGVVVGVWWGAVVGIASIAWFGWFWYGLALVRRAPRRKEKA